MHNPPGSGVERINATNTSFRKSFERMKRIFCTDASNIFRIPISLLRCRTLKADRPNNQNRQSGLPERKTARKPDRIVCLLYTAVKKFIQKIIIKGIRGKMFVPGISDSINGRLNIPGSYF
jgi:hypothetical protein